MESPLIDLMREWTTFTGLHPNGNLKEFCVYFLAKWEKVPKNKSLQIPTEVDGHFTKVITRLAQAYNLYARIALRDTKLGSYENFVFLATSRLLGETSKAEVTNYAMIDISTGSDILRRLIKNGYMTERIDANDRRSKLITISRKGAKVLQECFQKTAVARRIFLKGLSNEDKKLCILILEPVEIRHSKLSVASKNKSIEELVKQQFEN